MLGEIAISHLEHLVDERFDFLGHLAMGDQGVRGLDADLEQHSEVRRLDLIEFFNDFEYHVEAVVEQLVCLPLEVLIPYENAVIRVNVRDVVGQSVLALTRQIANHRCVHPHLEEVCLCTPLMVLE
jgi:hypothetical protein